MKGGNLCIIPAKGASTRLKRKNVVNLCGKPLLYYTVENAKKSKLFADIYVSTEDDDIKKVAESLGAIVPYKRPEELSHDPAGVVDVCLHMIEHLEREGKEFETLYILLPTSPLCTHGDILAARDIFNSSEAKVLMSVTEYDHTPFSALALDEEGFLTPHFEEYIAKKSQEVPRAFRCNGAVTILDIEEFKRQREYYFYPLVSYVMPFDRSVDIDTAEDLKLAEYLLSKRKG